MIGANRYIAADRQVDLAEDHHEHLARREDRERREVRQQRLEVAAREEGARVRREVDRHDDRDDDDAALAQRDDAREPISPPARQGPARVRRALRTAGAASRRAPAPRSPRSSPAVPRYLTTTWPSRTCPRSGTWSTYGSTVSLVRNFRPVFGFEQAGLACPRPCTGTAAAPAGSPAGRAAGRS